MANNLKSDFSDSETSSAKFSSEIFSSADLSSENISSDDGRNLVVCVPVKIAGNVIAFLKERSMLDTGRKSETVRECGISLIPVCNVSGTFFEVSETSSEVSKTFSEMSETFFKVSGMSELLRTFPEICLASSLNPVFIKKPVSLKTYARNNRSFLEKQDLVFTNDEIDQFPAGRQMIGDIAILTLPASLLPRKYDLARLLVLMEPSIRLVLNDSGIKGVFREPDREMIFPCPESGNAASEIKSGTDPEINHDQKFSCPCDVSTVVTHEENGCHFCLDVMKLMFSKGNLDEKRRMSRIGSGETIVDMFCGIGYFTIPMAVHARPSKIYAIELNPVSYEYLCKNIHLNHVENIVEPINGDCSAVTPKGIADRVLMGYVGTTHHFLDSGIAALKPEGGILHYHETVPEKLCPERPVERIRNAAAKAGRNTEILGCRIIKKYSPGVIHVVIDARIYGNLPKIE